MDEAKAHEIRQWLFKARHDLRSAAEALTPFATEFRYPGDLLEPEPADVVEGMELAEKVVEFVQARVPDEVKWG